MIDRGGSIIAGFGRVLGISGKLALIPIVLVIIVAGSASVGLFRSLSVPSAGENVTPEPRDRSGDLAQRIDQFRGRSLFFVPGPPAKPAPVVEETPKPINEGPPQPPSRYAGPAIIAMINDSVWFADGRRLSVGSEAERGLRVIRVEPPWRAVVEWSGAEFTVSFFDQDKVVLPEPARTAPATASNEGQS